MYWQAPLAQLIAKSFFPTPHNLKPAANILPEEGTQLNVTVSTASAEIVIKVFYSNERNRNDDFISLARIVDAFLPDFKINAAATSDERSYNWHIFEIPESNARFACAFTGNFSPSELRQIRLLLLAQEQIDARVLASETSLYLELRSFAKLCELVPIAAPGGTLYRIHQGETNDPDVRYCIGSAAFPLRYIAELFEGLPLKLTLPQCGEALPLRTGGKAASFMVRDGKFSITCRKLQGEIIDIESREYK